MSSMSLPPAPLSLSRLVPACLLRGTPWAMNPHAGDTRFFLRLIMSTQECIFVTWYLASLMMMSKEQPSFSSESSMRPAALLERLARCSKHLQTPLDPPRCPPPPPPRSSNHPQGWIEQPSPRQPRSLAPWTCKAQHQRCSKLSRCSKLLQPPPEPPRCLSQVFVIQGLRARVYAGQ